MRRPLSVYLLFSMFLSLTAIMGIAQPSAAAVQNPPVSTETMFSNRGIYFQMLVNKKLQSFPRLGFFSVTSLVGEWDQQQINDLMTQGNVTYKLLGGLDLSAGFHATPVTGFKPSVGMIYSYANPVWLFVVNPRMDLIDNGSIEGLILLEYKPSLNETWRFYSKLQGLYGYTPDTGNHARSYMIIRAGLNHKEFTFGAGANIDNYGPDRHNKNSVGLFLSVQL